ncbi:crotonase/enoyl-CoA hydratase family protein [Microvirga pakistanensis]|uniref:crotonase/enoyl-CoA hydratase family protein n=2 Tax=Microvirga pakistanensis TaxID=1682650 RepID=UPI00195A4581|nr:crotonase/enoyl-CoA hydratase family protein [Microvirga pakistanensis]
MSAVLYNQQGHVVTMILNKPESRNLVTDADILAGINEACDRAADDLSVRCVIVTGAGQTFSGGGNLKEMRDRAGSFAGSPGELRDRYRAGIQKTIAKLYNLEVPTIAAVNGPAYGAGFDITCACDIRIAAESAVFAENFVKVGIISGDGGSWLLPRAIGLSRAAEMTFTGEPIDASTALAWGLVSKVAPDEELMNEAVKTAGRIAVNPPRHLRMSKRLLRESQNSRFDMLLEMAAGMQGICHHTKDHEEAIRAIFERRSPNFVGE